MRARHLFILLAFALFASPLAAQETTGKIQGRVVDAQGLAVPGATVTATGLQGSKTTVTDAEGRFTIPFLTPGVYSVRAELQGFKAVEQKDVVGPRRPDGRRAPQARGRRRGGNGAGDRRGARRRHLVHDDRRRHQHGRPEVDSGRPHVQRHAVSVAPGVSSSGTLGAANPSMSGGSGPREPVRRRRRERHQHRLRRPRLVLDHVRLARQRDAVRLHQGSPGQDRRLRGRVRPGDRRRRQRHHQERRQPVPRIGVRLQRGRSGLESGWTQYQATNGTVQHVVHEDRRRGRRGRRPGRQGPRVLLRRDRPGAGRRGPSPRRRDFPLASLGERRPRDRQTTSYAAKATVQLNSANRIDASFFGDPSHGDNGPQRTSSLLRDRPRRASARSTTAATTRPSATTAS